MHNSDRSPSQADRYSSTRTLASDVLCVGFDQFESVSMADLSQPRDTAHWPESPDAKLLERLVDTHAHPTDYKQFRLHKEQYRDCTAALALSKVSLSLAFYQTRYSLRRLFTKLASLE